MKLRNHVRVLVLASFAVFSTSLLTGLYLFHLQSEQYRTYMLGRTAYITTLYPLAVEYFDQSYAAYQDSVQAKQGLFTPPPSLELAELSQHFKGLSQVKENTADAGKLAVVTFKEALKLTTEQALAQTNLSPDMLRKIAQDRVVTQMDFEILYKNKKELAEAEGKGNGQAKDSKGERQSENPANANQAGKVDRNAL